jgi:hypothetical protein
MADFSFADLASGVVKKFRDLGDGTAAEAQAPLFKPHPYGALGHYRTSSRLLLLNSQAAGSRLWSVRNSGTSLIIPMRLKISWLSDGANTAAIEDSLDVFKATAFTVSDSVSTQTPTASRMRTSMAAAPGGAEIRALQAAGLAAGMTGGTVTLDALPLTQLPQWLLLAVPTGGPVPPATLDEFLAAAGQHPLVLVQNEGLVIQNRVLLGAAHASSVYIDFSWAELASF